MGYDKSVNHNTGTVIYDSGSQKYFKAQSQVANYTSTSSTLSFANANSATASQRALHINGTSSKVYVAQNALPAIQAHTIAPSTKYAKDNIVSTGTEYKKATNQWDSVQDHTTGNAPSSSVNTNVIVHNSADKKFYQSQGDLRPSAFNNWTDTTFSGTHSLANTVKSGASFFIPKQNISNTFNQNANNTANNVVKESAGNYFLFNVDYHASWSGGPIPANDLVFIAADNAIYQNISGGANSTDPTSGGGTGWVNLGGDLQTVNAHANNGSNQLLQKYNTSDPATATDWWEDVTDAVTLTNVGHARFSTYWGDATSLVGTGTSYWTTTTDPQDLNNSTYWLEQSEGTDPNSGTIPGTPGGLSAIWQDVTNEVKLTNGSRPTTGANNGFWENVTSDATTLTTTGNWWNSVTNDLTNPSTTSNPFWEDVSTNTSADTIFNFSNVSTTGTLANSFWSKVTDQLTDPAKAGFSNWWSDETSNINNLNLAASGGSNLVDDYWVKVDLSTSNSTYWTEYAHANSWTDFDHEFWQRVEPGMARLIGSNGINPAFINPNTTEAIGAEHKNPDPTGYDWSDYVRQQDMTIWKRVANIHGYRGGANTNGTGQTDGSVKFGDHDTEEKIGRPSGGIQAWNNTDYYEAGDIVKNAAGTKYFRMRSGSNIDPEDTDWSAVGTGTVDPNNLNYTNDSNIYTPNTTDTIYQKWPGAASWDLIWDTSINGTASDDAVYKLSYTDTDYWEQFDIPAPTAKSMAENASDNWWELVQETTISSSQALGTVNLSAKIKDANFSGFDIKHFTHDGTMPVGQNNADGSAGTGLIQNGSFFIGEGAGAVRISYDVEEDSISDLMTRVSNSDAGVTMFYDPVGDRFVLRNDKAGAVGLTLHESPTDAGTFNPNPPFEWDSVTGNRGKGNVLQLMGLVDKTFQGDTDFGLTHDQAYPYFNNSKTYSKGDTVRIRIGNLQQWSYWRANESIPAGGGEPSVDTPKWVQVVPGVGRAIMSELGTNATIKLNDSENLIYSNEPSFGVDSHGYKGLKIDVSNGNVGDVGTFVISKDTSQAKAAIDKFVEEFNDAQDYIKSLTQVTNDGERVSSGKFSSNIEISRLGSQLRKVAFGDTIAHSKSELTTDGASLTIGSDTDVTSGSTWSQLATELELKSDGTGSGYIIKIENDSRDGNKTTYSIWEDQGGGTCGLDA